MYEKYSRQALPDANYRALLGSAICVFNSNFSFIVENVLRSEHNTYNWEDLINLEGGKLLNRIKQSEMASCKEICKLFDNLRQRRNRIVHSFQITNALGEQVLATREKDGNQYEITEEYLFGFIKDNERLSDLLHRYRGR